MSEDLIKQFDRIAATISTLHYLFNEELESQKKEVKQLRKDIETLSYYVSRLEKRGDINVK